MLVLHDRTSANPPIDRSTCIVYMIFASHVTKKSFPSTGTVFRLRPNGLAAEHRNPHTAMRPIFVRRV
jgi:hypothetical protein